MTTTAAEEKNDAPLGVAPPAPVLSEELIKADTFPSKTHHMIEHCHIHEPTAVRWTEEGDAFLVVDSNKLSVSYLPQYFKHSNFQSFVRQLNLYGFSSERIKEDSNKKKVKGPQPIMFRHDCFLKGRRDLLNKIFRSKKGERTNQRAAARKNEAEQVMMLQMQKLGSVSYDKRFDRMEGEFSTLGQQMVQISAKLDQLIGLMSFSNGEKEGSKPLSSFEYHHLHHKKRHRQVPEEGKWDTESATSSADTSTASTAASVVPSSNAGVGLPNPTLGSIDEEKKAMDSEIIDVEESKSNDGSVGHSEKSESLRGLVNMMFDGEDGNNFASMSELGEKEIELDNYGAVDSASKVQRQISPLGDGEVPPYDQYANNNAVPNSLELLRQQQQQLQQQQELLLRQQLQQQQPSQNSLDLSMGIEPLPWVDRVESKVVPETTKVTTDSNLAPEDDPPELVHTPAPEVEESEDDNSLRKNDDNGNVTRTGVVEAEVQGNDIENQGGDIVTASVVDEHRSRHGRRDRRNSRRAAAEARRAAKREQAEKEKIRFYRIVKAVVAFVVLAAVVGLTVGLVFFNKNNNGGSGDSSDDAAGGSAPPPPKNGATNSTGGDRRRGGRQGQNNTNNVFGDSGNRFLDINPVPLVDVVVNGQKFECQYPFTT